jgi:hypothetical protein
MKGCIPFRAIVSFLTDLYRGFCHPGLLFGGRSSDNISTRASLQRNRDARVAEDTRKRPLLARPGDASDP